MEQRKRYMRAFTEDYAILTGDKAKHTYIIRCKPWLCQQVMKETQETGTYVPSEKTIAQIVEDAKRFMVKERPTRTATPEQRRINDSPPRHLAFNERVPTFGVTIKMHKQTTPRFMAKSHGTTLTQLSQWISRTLKAMIPQSEQIWRNVFMSAGIVTTGSWVIWNNKQVRQRMPRMKNMSMHYGN